MAIHPGLNSRYIIIGMKQVEMKKGEKVQWHI